MGGGRRATEEGARIPKRIEPPTVICGLRGRNPPTPRLRVRAVLGGESQDVCQPGSSHSCDGTLTLPTEKIEPACTSRMMKMNGWSARNRSGGASMAPLL